MATETQHVGLELTTEEVKVLGQLLKHPEVKRLAEEMAAKDKKTKDEASQ